MPRGEAHKRVSHRQSTRPPGVCSALTVLRNPAPCVAREERGCPPACASSAGSHSDASPHVLVLSACHKAFVGGMTPGDEPT